MGQEIAFGPEMFLSDDHWTAIVSRREERGRCSEILKNSKIVLFLAFGGVFS